MTTALKIEFHNTAPIEEAESRVRQELAELERFSNCIMSCQVDVEVPEHPRRGNISKVRVDLGVHGATEHLEFTGQHKNVSMAIHAAFNAAHRRLKEFVAR